MHSHEKEYLAWRVADQRERHAKAGNTPFLQEPNVKNSCGGLRDYQNLLWISFFREGVTSTAELAQKKLLPESERRRLDRAYDFLLELRIAEGELGRERVTQELLRWAAAEGIVPPGSGSAGD